MIGAGVLGLPAAMAPLGWVGGLIVLVATFWISWYTYALLVHMHEVSDIDNKSEEPVIRRLDRYQELTTHVLGKGVLE
jgi:amino acid permease